MIDIESAKTAAQNDKEKWWGYFDSHYNTKRLYAMKAGKFVASSAANMFTYKVGGAIFQAPAVFKTGHHINRLNEIIYNSPFECQCQNKCKDIGAYVIRQKEKKLMRRTASMIPVAGSLESARGVSKNVYKRLNSTQGKERERNASSLLKGIHASCPMAQAIVAELVGSNFKEQVAWEKMFALARYGGFVKVVKMKLASN